MFQLSQMTTVRMLDVRTLTSKDRAPEDKPGAQMLMRAVLSADMLAMFDGTLPAWLYRKVASTPKGQVKLDGMESAELTSVGDHIKRLPWVYEQTGCEVEIDFGTGGRRNIKLSDCKVHRVSFHPQQGGSCAVQWTTDAPGLTDETRGKLSGLKSTDIELTLAPPKMQEDDLTGNTRGAPQPPPPPPPPAGKAKKGAAPPAQTPESALAAEVGGEPSDAAKAAIDKARATGGWPFPDKDGPKPDAGPGPAP